MEKNKSKKKTLTISSSFTKKIDKTSFKKTEKKAFYPEKKKTSKPFPKNKNFFNQPNNKKESLNKKNFARKYAEQQATKRFIHSEAKKFDKSKEKNFDKSKNPQSRREHKLTISRAMNVEEFEIKQRSLASVKRARLKEKKNSKVTDEGKKEFKKVIRDVKIPNQITIQELSNRMAEQSSSIIKFLLNMGVKATINHSIDKDTAEYIVKEFGHIPVVDQAPSENLENKAGFDESKLYPRPPIVTIMGHVDHGKTSLLDALRSTNVVSGEHGGITQHIGAYQVFSDDKKLITFIDTPGHAAFTEMRARGSKLTDIVILVVAADDGVKPQTIESIKHAKAAGVPIVVAINKCDLPEADPQKIKNQLLEYELIAEDLSGDTLVVEISTKTKQNLQKLIESVVLQAEILDLKTDFQTNAKGIVLESKIDIGRGPIANIIITAGTLKKGDFFVSGLKWGKVRAIINDQGKNIDIAEPSTPVEIIGINGASKAGDDFLVLTNEKEAKNLCDARIQETKEGKSPLTFVTQESAFKDAKSEELNIIIKSDVHGSSEAIKGAINQIKHDEVKPKILLSDIGMITETDVTLAKASKALLIAFNVKPSKEAKKRAEKEKITISSFNIIYEVLDFIKSKMSGLLTPNVDEKIIGTAEILEIFKVSKVGKVAGSKVVDGEITQDSNARVIRDGSIIFNGKIGSIFREKNQTKQVSAGLECGITLKDYGDFQKKDIIEVYNSTVTERTI